MSVTYFEDQCFEKIDFTQNPLTKGEYECCSFVNCDFSNSDLSDIRFVDCRFENCNLSMTKLSNTALREVKFLNCKMLGLYFDHCNPFGLSIGFERCNLSQSSFYQLKLKQNIFKMLTLHDVDFTNCDLSGSLFDRCDLLGAVFVNSVLEKTDFRSSFNYTIDPEANRIKHAKFSLSGIPGLLKRYYIEIDLEG
jgi:uncharacterized protein YjbI with pentapeptide repeats